MIKNFILIQEGYGRILEGVFEIFVEERLVQYGKAPYDGRKLLPTSPDEPEMTIQYSFESIPMQLLTLPALGNSYDL